MGQDKGTLEYHGRPQALHLLDLLRMSCDRCYVSINADQMSEPFYSARPAIIDAMLHGGPASGLISAWRAHPEVGWLAVAVDLALLDRGTLAALVAGRRASAAATAFRHPDGTLEPLCAIWEPAACALLAERVERGDASPRRCLEAIDTHCVVCPNPEALRSIDSPAQQGALLRER